MEQIPGHPNEVNSQRPPQPKSSFLSSHSDHNCPPRRGMVDGGVVRPPLRDGGERVRADMDRSSMSPVTIRIASHQEDGMRFCPEDSRMLQ